MHRRRVPETVTAFPASLALLEHVLMATNAPMTAIALQGRPASLELASTLAPRPPSVMLVKIASLASALFLNA